MRIHQAFFGDKNGSHNLIASSFENKLVIGFLKLNTDIPASITISESYLSGFPIEGYYVFTRTMNDPASERPGMGFSHCLIIAKEDISSFNQLNELNELFVGAPHKDVQQISDIHFLPSSPESDPITPTGIDLLAKLTTNTTSVIYPGYAHFESDVAQLWSILSPELRSNFSFTISGSPNEIANEQISLIHTPENFEPRWSKFPIVKAKLDNSGDMESIRLLANPKNADSVAFKELIRVNSINFGYLHQYQALAKLFLLSRQALANPNAVLLKRVIGSINQLIPKPEHGAHFKKKILSLFIAQVSLTDATDILLIRNMVFIAFEDGQRQISQLLDLWSKTFILPKNISFFPDGIKALEEAYLPANPGWWKEKIIDQFDRLCGTIDASAAHFVWKLWTYAPSLLQHTKLKTSDERLISAQKTLVGNPIFYHELSKFSAEKKWYYIHAESVSNELTPHHAVLAQLKLDKSVDLEKHLDVIRNNIKDHVFFKECLAIDNKTLHQMGGKLLVSHPTYFQDVDMSNLNWQKVWYELFQLSGKINPNDKPITSQFMSIIAQVVAKSEHLKPLLKVVAQHSGNIYNYDQRRTVWPLLENETKNIILNKTCIYIISRFDPLEWQNFELEIKNSFLVEAFINDEIIQTDVIGIAAKIKILETIGKLSDNRVIEIIQANNNLVNQLEADTLIKAIIDHKYGETLDYCYLRRGNHTLFNEIVNGCEHMLTTWERLWLTSSAPPVRLDDIYKEVDRQNLPHVFQILRKLGFTDQIINRLQDEFVAGVKGIELIDLCNRLKAYIHSKL